MSEKYNFLVSQTKRPIAKSLPKTLNLKSTIFEYRRAFLAKITYTKHSQSVSMLGTKFSGSTSSSTYQSKQPKKTIGPVKTPNFL